jgi:phosphohistidine phosphatase
MKTLLIMRHAKSSWKEPDQKDEKRPLSKKGKKQAAQMGSLLKNENILPDMIISSSVNRAEQTTKLVVENSNYQGEVLYLDRLFMAEVDVIYDVLKLLPDQADCVLLIGHNPGLEGLLQILTGKVESLPTAAIASLSLPINSWKEINDDTHAKLNDLWRPKEIERSKDEKEKAKEDKVTSKGDKEKSKGDKEKSKKDK